MEVYHEKDRKKLRILAQSSLSEALQSYTERTLFLSSGGSCLELLNKFPQDSLSNTLTVTVLDERAYEDSAINNFSQIKQLNFYEDVKTHGGDFIDTVLKEGESEKELATRFEDSLKVWRERNPGGRIIATFGVGEDGHISGLMPYPEDKKYFNDNFLSSSWVTSYDAGDKNKYPLRVTTTLTFILNNIDCGIVYIVGESKKLVLRKLLDNSISQDMDMHSFPAIALKKLNVKIFTDIEDK